MPQSAPVESLVAVMKAPESGPDTYIKGNNHHFASQEGVQFVFGRSLIARSAAAAATTAPAAFQIYSVQSAFLRAAKPAEEVYYRVERTSDGRGFASRVVRATQGSARRHVCVYVAVVGLRRSDLPAAGNCFLDYHVPMPEVGGVLPDDDVWDEKLEETAAAGIAPSTPVLRIGKEEEEPFEWRAFDDNPPATEPTKRLWQRSFVRSPALASQDPHVHQAALAFLSDTFALDTARFALDAKAGLGKLRELMRDVTMATTLTNNVSLHEPMARIDEWMLGERETSWGADGRVLIHQRFWDVKSGRLVMSGTQEGLVRLKEVGKL